MDEGRVCCVYVYVFRLSSMSMVVNLVYSAGEFGISTASDIFAWMRTRACAVCVCVCVHT